MKSLPNKARSILFFAYILLCVSVTFSSGEILSMIRSKFFFFLFGSEIFIK